MLLYTSSYTFEHKCAQQYHGGIPHKRDIKVHVKIISKNSIMYINGPTPCPPLLKLKVGHTKSLVKQESLSIVLHNMKI